MIDGCNEIPPEFIQRVFQSVAKQTIQHNCPSRNMNLTFTTDFLDKMSRQPVLVC
ncbi:hypothetical protein D3C87_974370 [compost metagenome]